MYCIIKEARFQMLEIRSRCYLPILPFRPVLRQQLLLRVTLKSMKKKQQMSFSLHVNGPQQMDPHRFQYIWTMKSIGAISQKEKFRSQTISLDVTERLNVTLVIGTQNLMHTLGNRDFQVEIFSMASEKEN